MVSIILPTYNGSKYIRESIESILQQTYENWELIIIDDCSKDDTPQIIAEYAKLDKRIRVYRNENNLRLPASLNKGFSLSKGDFLTWTSDDNKYKPNAIEVLQSKLTQNTNLGLVFSAMDYIDSEGVVREVSQRVEDKNEIYYKNIVMASFMYTREAYEKTGDYDTKRFLVEDYDYWLRIVENFDFDYIAESLYFYRTHEGSLTETRNRQMLEAKVDLYESELHSNDFSEIVLRNIYRELAIANFSLDRYQEMRTYIKKMKSIRKDFSDLPKKVRVSWYIGGTLTNVLKKVYKGIKEG